MSQFVAALTAAGTAVTAGLVVIARSWPQPTSAPQPMVRPIEALQVVEAHCLVEHRTTVHVRFACGDLMCLDCRTTATNSAPSKGD
jgi:hypothetical protein